MLELKNIKKDYMNKSIGIILCKEDNEIVIEAEVFGSEGFESSKSDFKIVTLKITDYTDSIYAKVFTRDKDEYEKYLKTTIKIFFIPFISIWIPIRKLYQNITR